MTTPTRTGTSALTGLVADEEQRRDARGGTRRRTCTVSAPVISRELVLARLPLLACLVQARNLTARSPAAPERL